MGTKVEAPQPTAEETQLQRQQLEIAQRQADQQKALEPFQLQAAGLTRDRIDVVQQKVPTFEEFASGKDVNIGNLRSLKNEHSALVAEIEAANNQQGPIRRLTEEERRAGLTDLQRQQEGVQRSLLERQQQALAGKVPISPALEADLQRQQDLITASNAQSGRAGGTLGQRAQSLFQTRADLVREEARRGLITGLTGSSLGFAGLSGQQGAQAFGGLQGLGSSAGRTIGLLGAAAQPFQQQRILDFQAQQQTAQNKAGLIGSIFGAAGTGIGLAAGGGFFSKKPSVGGID